MLFCQIQHAAEHQSVFSSMPHKRLTARRRFICPLADCRVTVEPGGPSARDQASMLYNDWLLDMPKLLDIAVLYGRENPALVQQLMQKVSRSFGGMLSTLMTLSFAEQIM